MKIVRIVSPCKKYQYLRTVEIKPGGKKPLGIIGLNPSIIKNGKNSTVSILSQIALREGFDSLIITNLYGYITPNPKDLKKVADPIGRDNDAWIKDMVNSCDSILCIWGNSADKSRVEKVLPIIKNKAYTIGFTKLGQPRHVLHTKKEAPLLKL